MMIITVLQYFYNIHIERKEKTMIKEKKFPLISGHLSLDLVNTELISRGKRHDLLNSAEDVILWLQTMRENNLDINDDLICRAKNNNEHIIDSIREFRFVLRKNFESIADGDPVSVAFINALEENISNAPFTYKFILNKLIRSPIGKVENGIISLISYDVLHLLEMNKLKFLKRCANPECVLLFLDESGRRKWCSMRICGNRKKVARFQNRKLECKGN